MRREYLVGSFACLLVVTAFLMAGDFRRDKDYRRWSAKECEALLERSPWAHPHALTGLLIPAPMNPRGGIAADRGTRIGGGFDPGDREVHLVLQMRFLAARPIRAALGSGVSALETPDALEVEVVAVEFAGAVDLKDPIG